MTTVKAHTRKTKKGQVRVKAHPRTVRLTRSDGSIEELKWENYIKKRPLEQFHTIPMRNIMDLNEKHGGFWFSDDTVEFFNSEFGSSVYAKTPTSDVAYFISSEKQPSIRGTSRIEAQSFPRKFSIRSVNLKNGAVDTVNDFGEYSTQKKAEKVLVEMLK